MAPHLFLTGGTGYIGGTVLDTLVKTHPEYNISVLLRHVPEDFVRRYPDVKIVMGDYDSGETISNAAVNANVVIHNGNSDHEPSINALIAGLLRRGSPSFLIHLSGTGIVADWLEGKYVGKLNPKVWNDIDDLDEIVSRPDRELHRNVDKIIQKAASDHGDRLKTAIVCPPDIYGTGRGPGRTQSVFFPLFVKQARAVGRPFYAGDGTNTRSWVHIEDLMVIYLKLVEAAVNGGKGADWGRDGYYFAATQEASQVDIAKAAGKILKATGVLSDAEPCKIADQEVDTMLDSWSIPHLGTYMFAANSRTRAHRAAKLFGYEGKSLSLWEAMEADLSACV
ncbi:NAD(P)-binding protein [Acrodontium crateriforme]|uniref:NAD(P)-binding protein n=1 Tax=Acrodontium crateriforme TaxID=150365 RepID=A0AAQ3M3Q0_9PEZI|nr:NAD(P)-binding protein [Acrodontium crateriforme]